MLYYRSELAAALILVLFAVNAVMLRQPVLFFLSLGLCCMSGAMLALRFLRGRDNPVYMAGLNILPLLSVFFTVFQNRVLYDGNLSDWRLTAAIILAALMARSRILIAVIASTAALLPLTGFITGQFDPVMTAGWFIILAGVSVIVFPSSNPKSNTVLSSLVNAHGRVDNEALAGILLRSLEQSPSSIVITDTDGRILYVNPKFESITGYTVKEALGQNPRILKSGEMSPENYRLMWDTISRGREWRGEFHNRKKNGDSYWESASISAVMDHSGEITHYIAIKEDITVRKMLEMGLQKANTDLQELNAGLEERISRAVEDLRRNEQMLILQNRQAAMGEMLSAIIHQWRQPLSALMLTVQNAQFAIREGGCNVESMIKSLDKIYRQADFLNQTIEDFRSFFKPGREKKRFRIIQAVDRALELTGHSLAEHNIRIVKDVPEGLELTGFANELLQVLLVLFNNARDAAVEKKPPDPFLGVTAGRDKEGFFIRVADNAGGIREDILPRLFQQNVTGKAAGTGIGLTIARMLVEKGFNGSLTAGNKDGGAEFTINIPAASD